jgi:hypothetical protein
MGRVMEKEPGKEERETNGWGEDKGRGGHGR